MPTSEQQTLRLSLALKGTKIGLWDWNIKENRISFDANYFLIAGYGPDEFPQTYEEWKKRVHSEDIAPTEKAIQQYLAGELEFYIVEFRFKTKTDGWIWLLDQGEIVERDKKGNPVRFLGLCIDITQRKQAEEALQESELRFRMLADYTYDWEYWINPDGKYIYLSPSCERITGYSSEELISNPQLLFDMIRPDYAEKFHSHYEDEANKETPVFSTVVPIVTKNGEERWLEHNCSPVFDGQGHYAGRLGNNRDITERKQAEEVLRKEMMFSKSLVDTAQTIVLVLDVEGRILQFNPYMEEISGYKLAEVKGRDWFSTFLPAEDHSKIRAVFQEVVGDIQIRGNVNPILTKDGRKLQINWYNKTLKDADENVVGLLAVGHDITELKNAEEVLRKLDQAKSDFISTVAHELRTPLTVIAGYVELLEEEHKESYFTIIQSNIEVLKRLIDDLMDIGRIHIEHPLGIKPQETNLEEIIEKVVASERMKCRQCKIIVTHNKTLPETLWIDGNRITQVLNNLLSNAIKYSPHGGTVKIQTMTDEEKVTVSIQDQGMGMTTQQVEHIFDRFYRADSSNLGITGLGLGLTIVKQIIADHGGETSVSSHLGEGTTVAFTLPRRRRG